MPTNSPNLTESTPGKPPVDKYINVADLYLLHYRHNSAFSFIGFECKGGLKAARERSLKHCNRMGYRQLFVQEFIRDMDAVEKAMDAKSPDEKAAA